jgi:uncharacterized protein (DUF4415 family)
MTAKKRASKTASPSGDFKGKPVKGWKGRSEKDVAVRHLLKQPIKTARRAWVDPDDAPEWTAEQFARADLYHGDKLIRRGRPPSDNPKQALKLRIDADVVEHFRATGPGWQTRINDTLRRAAKLPARKYEPIER